MSRIGNDLHEALSKGTGGEKSNNLKPEPFSPGSHRLIHGKGGKVREMTDKEMKEWEKGTVYCMDEHGDFPLIHKNDLKAWLEGHPERKVLEE